MKKIVTAISLLILLAGCTSHINIRPRNALNLLKLSLGMNRQEVLDVMGGMEIVTFCEGGIVNCPTIANPYHTAAFKSGDKTFEVLYYYTDIKKT